MNTRELSARVEAPLALACTVRQPAYIKLLGQGYFLISFQLEALVPADTEVGLYASLRPFRSLLENSVCSPSLIW